MNDKTLDAAAAMEAMTGKPRRELWADTPPRLLVSAAVFGAVFSYLFVNQLPGLNFTVFVLLVYGFTYYNRGLFVRRTFRQEPLIYLFTIPAIFLAVYFFVGDTELNVLSLLVIILIMFVQYVVISGNALYRWDRPGFFIDLVFAAVNQGILAMGLFLAGVFRRLFKERSSRKRGVLIGIGAGLALLLIVVPMLALSDPTVSGLLNGFFEKINVGDIFLYAFMFLLGSSLVTAPVASAKSDELSGTRHARESAGRRPIQSVTAGVALSMLGVVYVLFAAVQFRYFFMPYETINKVLGLTSSSYAVRGFGELLLITCINFIVIAAAVRFSELKNGRLPVYLKGLLMLLVVFNFVIMASSHLRMQCYEASFGFTVMRFLPHSFMTLLLVLNVIMLVRIFKDNVKVFRLFVAAALCYLCVIVAINPDRFVAQANIARYERAVKAGEQVDIDLDYLFTLSDNAMPEVCGFVETHPDMFSQSIRRTAKARWEGYIWSDASTGWQSFNISRQQAGQSLEQMLQ